MKESKKSDMHVLVPVSLNLMFHKCLITDDPRLPLTKIKAELPSINVTMSDAKILLLYALVSSIPLPSKDNRSEVEIPVSIL